MTTPKDETLISLPASIFCFSLCPFLDPADLLSIRVTSWKAFQLLHNEPESEELWKMLLIRDFGFSAEDGNSKHNEKDWWKFTLRVEFPIPNCTSIFGINPSVESPIVEVEDAFESWKGWRRASARFYEDLPVTVEKSTPVLLIHAPYFLKAARIWEQIYGWCSKNNLGETIVESFSRGLRFKDWDHVYRSRPGLKACQAVYAFCGGQSQNSTPGLLFGLFGGYHAYDFCSISYFTPPRDLRGNNTYLGISYDPLPRSTRMFAVNMDTGALVLLTPAQGLCRAIRDPQSSVRDELLVWMEEFANRLTTQQIGEGVIEYHALRENAITLYPRWTQDVTTSTSEDIQICSRAITRGIEVVGSSIFVPQAAARLGFIYSIRIRLLTPGEEGYMSPSERGFTECQLQSRHWQISNFETGNVDNVDGPGVIGMYPVLTEGGYYLSGQLQRKRTFQYQSCSGPMNKGCFQGEIEFVPGTISSPTGIPFRVELKPFLLDSEPAYIF